MNELWIEEIVELIQCLMKIWHLKMIIEVGKQKIQDIIYHEGYFMSHIYMSYMHKYAYIIYILLTYYVPKPSLYEV